MQKFTQAHKLKKADEFSSVFIFRKAKFGKFLRFYFKPNSELLHSRLGLIVSKKIHKKSNKRFYMKRVLRELFRMNQEFWFPYDVVIKVQKLFTKNEFKEIKEEFNFLTKHLVNNKLFTKNNI